MTHEIIKVENYLLVVDESEIKENNCSFYPPFGIGKNITIDGELCFHIDAKNGKGSFTQITYQTLDRNKKIIAHRPLHNAPFLEGVDVLPPTEEDDVEKLALEYSGDLEDKISNVSYDAYIKGYNKAKENLHEILSDFYYYATDGEVCKHETINEFIQSLSQPKMPTHFEVFYDIDTLDSEGKVYQMTTTNNLGQTQWVGKYIYD